MATKQGPLQADTPPLQRSQSMLDPVVSMRRPIRRSVSNKHHYNRAFEREHHCERVNIAYHDDALPAHSLENIYQLLRDVQTIDNQDIGALPNDQHEIQSTNSNRVQLAKKVLRYRRLLRRAEEVDLDDPTFDIHEFLRVTWHKVDAS